MGPSTNASCQPEKPENWYSKTWGSASTQGLSLHSCAVSFPTGETARRARTCRMWRVRATVAVGAAVKIMGVGSWYAEGMAPQVGFGSEHSIDSTGTYWFYCNTSNVFGQKCPLCTTDLSHVTDFLEDFSRVVFVQEVSRLP
jgi:hypothetical protein